MITRVLQRARQETEAHRIDLCASVTTNGTCAGGDAWELLLCRDLHLSISFDGTPDTHDAHRRYADGRPSSNQVLQTMRRLRDAGKPFDVVMVVRPDSVLHMPDGLCFLREQGVAMVVPTLDVWAFWKPEDLDRLEDALVNATQVWREGLPEFGVSWFNEKLVQAADVPVTPSARCGFGVGEVALAPSGRLYPCERLIGEDQDGQPLCLPGHVFEGTDFLTLRRPHESSHPEAFGLSCRCANYVRTGCTGQPDRLLRRLDDVCDREVRRLMTHCTKIPVATE